MHLNLLRRFASLMLVAGAVSSAGCSSIYNHNVSELQPIEFTYIRIGQDQYSTALNPTYEGSVAFPVCRHNPNKFEVMVEGGFEVYLVLGPPGSGLKLVKKSDFPTTNYRAGGGTIPVGMIHNVLLNETVEGNSTDYTIHFWHQILNPEPVHRVDRWFNMTFTPYGPSSTTYSEGTPC